MSKPVQWSSATTHAEKETLLFRLLTHYGCAVQNEIVCQDSIEKVFKLHHVPYARECRLGDAGIIDFVVDEHWGIEVKIKGSRMPIYRQCVRYCQSGMIQSLILATMYPMNLPECIEGVPARVVTLLSANLKRML